MRTGLRGPIFRLTGQNTGKSSKSGPPRRYWCPIGAQIQRVGANLILQRNRETFWRITGKTVWKTGIFRLIGELRIGRHFFPFDRHGARSLRDIENAALC